MLAKGSIGSEMWPIRLVPSRCVPTNYLRRGDRKRSARPLVVGQLPSYLESRGCSVILKQNADRFTVVDAADSLGEYRCDVQYFELGAQLLVLVLGDRVGHDNLI